MRIGFVVPKKVCGFEHRVPYTWQLPWLSVSVKITTDPIPPPLINLGHIVDSYVVVWTWELHELWHSWYVQYVLLIVCTHGLSPSLHPSLGPQRFHLILQKLLWEEKQPQRSVKMTPLFQTPWDQKFVLVREVSSFELDGFCWVNVLAGEWVTTIYHWRKQWRWVR